MGNDLDNNNIHFQKTANLCYSNRISQFTSHMILKKISQYSQRNPNHRANGKR